MKILIFGASGTVGSALFTALSPTYDVYGTYNKKKPATNDNHWLKYDLSEPVEDILKKIKPSLIISSLTGDFAKQWNAHRHMAEYLRETAGQMIYISTANVFDGAPVGGHTESDIPYPISQYGLFKQSCEEMVLWSTDCLIVRLPRILSKNNTDGWAERMSTLYSNVYFNYNSAENVAQEIKYCIQANDKGTIHLVSQDYLSDVELAEKLSASSGKKQEYAGNHLDAQEFCKLLGHADVSTLRQSSDGKFYLTMTGSQRNVFTCDDVVKSLYEGVLK